MKEFSQQHLYKMRYTFFLIFGLISFLFFTSCTEKEKSLVVLDRVDVLSTLAREPMIAEHPSGDLYLTGYRNGSEEPQLWRSKDQGKSWTSVDVGTRDDGADGNSDVDLKIDAEGVIYFISMRYTTIPEEMESFDFSSLKGKHIAVGVSEDNGDSWSWSYVSQNDFDDRPWLVIASDGSANLIWNDGNGVHYAKSLDNGKTWDRKDKIYPQGGSSHMAAGPDGQLAVRVAPLSASGMKFDEGIDLIRLSTDLGDTWTSIGLPPGERVWNENINEGILRWVEPLAWDEESRLYHLWSEGTRLKIGITSDNGDSWNTFSVEESADTIYYPYLDISNGQISCSWVAGFGTALTHNCAVLNLIGDSLHVNKLEALKLEDVKNRFNPGDELSTGGEYFPITTLSNGDFGMATTIQNHKENRLGFTWWRLGLQ